MKDKGFITITSVLILTFVLIMTLAFYEKINFSYYYINNSKDSVQQNYILESHLNILFNRKEYRDILDDFILFNLQGRINTGIKSFSIREEVYENTQTKVNMDYNKELDIALIKLENSKENSKITMEIELEVINKFYRKNLDTLNIEIFEDDERQEYSEYLDYIYNITGETVNENIIITADDIIIEENIEFSGIIISTNGKIIVENDKELSVNGLIMTREENEGNIFVNKDMKLIRKIGTNIPGFTDYKIINKKLN